jgi:hypothetical protein
MAARGQLHTPAASRPERESLLCPSKKRMGGSESRSGRCGVQIYYCTCQEYSPGPSTRRPNFVQNDVFRPVIPPSTLINCVDLCPLPLVTCSWRGFLVAQENPFLYLLIKLAVFLRYVAFIRACSFDALQNTSWSESASELYRPRDRRLSAKWLPTFADRGCHVVSVTDPYSRVLGFLNRSRYFSIK